MKEFYVYCVYRLDESGNEAPLYVGKGHDDSNNGYSRMQHYRDLNKSLINAGLHAQLMTIIKEGGFWGIKKLIDADDEMHAYALERHFIAEFGRDLLHNKTDGGCAGWTLSQSSKDKMSRSRLGKKLGPISEEHRQKLREAAKKRAADPAWRKAHSATMLGKRLTEETKRKMSLASLGKPKTAEHARAISLAKTGVPLSESHKQHMSKAMLGTKRGHYKTRVDALPPEERHARRLDTYRRSYAKRAPIVLVKLQAERDAVRLSKWQAECASKGLPLDTPLPGRISPLVMMDEQQRVERKRARERINHHLRKAVANGDQAEIVRLGSERRKLDDGLIGQSA